MYGSLREIDIRSLLELIEKDQHTGQLLVDTSSESPTQKPSITYSSPASPESNHLFWLISFNNGQITYAVNSTPFHRQRLEDYLHRYQAASALEKFPQQENPSFPDHLSIIGRTLPEYNYLWLLLEHHILSAAQARLILSKMVQETLFDLLSLQQGYFVFHSNTVLEPELTKMEITPFLSEITRRLQQWKQLYPYITSPEQCPFITEVEQLQKSLMPAAYRSLAVTCQGQLSLRRISRYLHKDLLTLSKALYPYIQRGWLQLLDPEEQTEKTFSEENSKRSQSQVVCIDEQNVVSDQIEYMLRQQGHRLITISDPMEALSVIMQRQPSLIFCPLEMSTFSGEQLSHFLRGVPSLSSIPIILLTPENPDPLRIVRAQLLGVTEFIAQPIQQSDLSRIMRTYLGGIGSESKD